MSTPENGNVVTESLSAKKAKALSSAASVIEANQELKEQIDAINASSAFIEFLPDGTIIKANELFLGSMKYIASEIEGKHHRIFCESSYAQSREYSQFWENLRRGIPQVGEVKRVTKDGREIWLQANYTPVKNTNGEVTKIIKLAVNTTDQKTINADYLGQIEAIGKSQAVIEFNLDGTIISANDNFLKTVGYSLNEIKGKHHSMFVETSYSNSFEYKEFWAKLNQGQFLQDEYKRIGKGGKEIWIQASYNPIMDLNGTPFKVVKYAINITEQKIRNADYLGQIDAIGKSQAVIEFNLDGTIITANDNFLKTVGYSLNEIKGKHHSMFVETSYSNSFEYKEFWAKLNQGQFLQDEYKRIGKGGKEVWIQASYNPIMDLNGLPFKVVKYATNVTEQKLRNADYLGQLDAIGKSQAVIEFNMDGTILTANENFLLTVGYSLNEIKGKHHSMFVESLFANSSDYKDFWAKLNRGQYMQDEYKRLAKGGKEVWIQASYNPILDLNGKPFKVVKYATDITEQKNRDKIFKEQVNTISNVILQMSKGDLTSRVTINTTGDIQTMADALNAAIENINDLLFSIGKNADVVSSSSVNMLEKTEGMKRNTGEVASAISQMAKGAQDQATRTDESSKLVEKVKNSSEDMEEKANAINLAAEKGQKGSENGLRTMKVLVNNMTGIKDSAQQTSKSIEILTQRAEEIGRTLNVITDIASQTNLLALNAAIEAARAGDAGRGFAVVAEEIRKLAEDSRKSAVEIEKIISDVQKDTQAAGKAIDTMQISVREGSNATNEAELIFQEIATSTQTTFDYSKKIQDASIDQKSAIELVVKNIEQIVVVAEETAAGTQQAASSSQQLNNSMGEIADSSNKLTGVAKELQAGVEKFKLRKVI